MSPPAKTFPWAGDRTAPRAGDRTARAEVFRVFPFATTSPASSTFTIADQSAASALLPMASTAAVQSSTHSDPLIGSGLRRPEVSGFPSRVRTSFKPFSFPFESARYFTGWFSSRKWTPSRRAATRSSSSAGIWAKDRR